MSVTRTCNEWPLAYETTHKTFATMKNEQIANLLAQIGNDRIEENEVVNILKEQYDAMPCEEEENREFDRLFAATRISKANKTVMEGYKRIVIEAIKKLTKGYESITVNIGLRMFKFYYQISCHWERVHLPELTDEQRSTMTESEIKAYEEKREKLLEWHQLFKEITDLEKKIAPMKPELKGKSDALAILMPTSKCIQHTPIVQAL